MKGKEIFLIYIYIYICNKIMVFFFSFSFLLLLLHTSIGSFCAYIKLKKKNDKVLLKKILSSEFHFSLTD